MGCGLDGLHMKGALVGESLPSLGTGYPWGEGSVLPG